MRVALHDSEGLKYPNLALMKLSTYCKQKGWDVEWFNPNAEYDKVFSAKVFTFTEPDTKLPKDTIKGGTGYKKYEVVLPDVVEHIVPDYSLYGINYSMGFLTRGCPNKCNWCIVPHKEGAIRKHADVEEFTIHKEAVFMDNNVLASAHGIEQIKKIGRLGIKIDFNQGLDARRIDSTVASILAECKWRAPVRLACDTIGQIESIERAVELLRWHNCTPRKYFVYVLVKENIEDALERVRVLKKLNLDPFAQPYLSFMDGEAKPPTQLQKDFARWVNHKAIFNSVSWEKYRAKK